MSDEARNPPADRLSAEAAFVGIKAGLMAFHLMAKRGLVSPNEAEEYISGMLDSLTPCPDDPPGRARQLETMRSLMEGHMLQSFARIRYAASQNWNGQGVGRQSG